MNIYHITVKNILKNNTVEGERCFLAAADTMLDIVKAYPTITSISLEHENVEIIPNKRLDG